MKPVLLSSFFCSVLVIISCGGNEGLQTQHNEDPLSEGRTGEGRGNETRVKNTSSNAFSSHVKNMEDVERIRRFNIGDDFFENPWIEKSASTELRDGLGPLFNNNACQDCHIRDGRGQAPGDQVQEGENAFASMLFRAARTDISDDQLAQMLAGTLANVGDSSVGGQLQQEAIFNITKEAGLGVEYRYFNVAFDDGFQVELREPLWQLVSHYASSGYDFDADTLFSARVAQPMIGLGLLALIDEEVIKNRQDPQDKDQDGISGKANMVWDVLNNKTALGRFGWKAGQPTVRQQSAGAFSGDMGLTSEIFPVENCLSHQSDCLNSPTGNGDSLNDYDFEVASSVLDAVEFYASHLAVPMRREIENVEVKLGEKLFNNAGCAGCHVAESYTTVEHADFPELSNKIISPYTDLLLHDMGEALADFDRDNKPAGEGAYVEFRATAREWRTSPLWGLGLNKTVNPETSFLHDGRARTIMEAILWHGGEAEVAKNIVLTFNETERQQLLAFLNDL